MKNAGNKPLRYNRRMTFRAAAKERRLFLLAAVCCASALFLSPAADASRGIPAAIAPALEAQTTPDQVLEAEFSDPPERLRIFGDLRLPPHPLELVEASKIASGVKHYGLGLNIRQTGDLSRESGGLSFQGLWTDPVTGISYARNRWYDARTASWLSEDPLGAVDSPNLYAFVGWRPHAATDPLGLRGPSTWSGSRQYGAQGQVTRQVGRQLANLRDSAALCWRGMSAGTGDDRFIQGCIEAFVDAGAAHMSTRVQQSTALGGSVGEGAVVALAEMMTPFGSLTTAVTGEVPYEGPVDSQARADAGFDAFFATAEFGLGLRGGGLLLSPGRRGLDLDLDSPSGLDFIDEGNRRVQLSREGIAEPERLVALDNSQRFSLDKLPVRRPRAPTSGLLSFGDGSTINLTSSRGGPPPTGINLSDLGQISRDAAISLTHVEGRAAAYMRSNNINHGRLIINYEGGPCRFCVGQETVSGVQELLGPDQILEVVYPLPAGATGRGYFVGGPDGGFVSELPDY